jgi:hypothetical protein
LGCSRVVVISDHGHDVAPDIILASQTQIQNAALLVVANVRFDSVNGILADAALKATNVADVVISQSTFSSNTQLNSAPLVLASCGTVRVTDSTFYSNSGSVSGGVVASTVGSLSIEDSSFAFNTGGRFIPFLFFRSFLSLFSLLFPIFLKISKKSTKRITIKIIFINGY